MGVVPVGFMVMMALFDRDTKHRLTLGSRRMVDAGLAFAFRVLGSDGLRCLNRGFNSPLPPCNSSGLVLVLIGALN